MINLFRFLQFKTFYLALALVAIAANASAYQKNTHNIDEEYLKIAFISKFIKYIDNNWNHYNEYNLCILGDNKNLNQISMRFSVPPINNKKFIITPNLNKENITKNKCNILYFSKYYRDDPKEILEKNYQLLSIGDLRYFTDNGGIIEFFNYRGKIRFKINDVAAKKANIEFNSKLLELGEIR
jgi:hypothetical protein